MCPSYKELTTNEKNRVAQFLLANSNNGKTNHGKIKEASELWGVSRRSIHNIWQAAKIQVSEGLAIQIKSNRKGQPHKKLQVLDRDKMRSIPFSDRSTIRRLASGLGVSKSQVGRWVKDGEVRPHTNPVKPKLTDDNKLQRINYSLHALEYHSESNEIKFQGMYNVVHIDEKWFYMIQETQRFYILEGEEEPHRMCKSKRYIPKIMFMCGVARPQYATNGELIFDGKIGIFPFTTLEPAKRNSKNRTRGTLETKPIESITKEVIRDCLINKMIPAIKAKWPPNACKNIIIQQDNARPHISNNDPEFRAVASSDGFNIIIVCQPPNSPDTNILDLGFFRAIQSLQVDNPSKNVDELVNSVLLSYETLTAVTLNNVFLTLQSCLVEIMKVMGSNNYKVSHMNKAQLIRQERLPTVLQVDEELVRVIIQQLMEVGDIEELKYDIGPLLLGLGH